MVKHKEPAKSNNAAFKDSIVLGTCLIVVFVLSYFLNVFRVIIRIFQRYPQTIEYIDDILVLLVTLSIGLAVFSWRRLKELKIESAERIMQKEELLKCAETSATVEKIINTEIRSDMDEIRKELREINCLLSGRKK